MRAKQATHFTRCMIVVDVTRVRLMPDLNHLTQAAEAAIILLPPQSRKLFLRYAVQPLTHGRDTLWPMCATVFGLVCGLLGEVGRLLRGRHTL